MLTLLVVCFICSAVFSIIFIRRARKHARAYASDLPQRFHKGSIPRLGGAAMLIALVFGLVVVHFLGARLNIKFDQSEIVFFILALLPAIVCGILEDLTQRIPIKVRLLITFITALLICYVAGVRVPRFDLPYIDEMLRLAPWVGLVIAAFAICGLTHAFNIIDGYNGLAGMVAVMMSAAIVHVALQLGDRLLASLLVCLVGATIGFLVFNYPAGKIFAGDGGAYLWGVVIGFGCVALVSRHAAVSPWFPMLLLSYPVFETAFSIYRKLARGQSPGMADALHLHQLIYRRIVKVVMDEEDDAKSMKARNNKTSPYLWGVALTTIVPAVLFWNNSMILMVCCFIFSVIYVSLYLSIIRFKLPSL